MQRQTALLAKSKLYGKRFHTKCPHCGGERSLDDCNECGGLGFVFMKGLYD